LVFLVGGNGSGKSTLAKIISGLYLPEAGELRLDGELITNHNRDDFRQLFSAVFSDFYLFDNLLGLNKPDLDAQARIISNTCTSTIKSRSAMAPSRPPLFPRASGNGWPY